MFKFEGLSFMK